MPGLLWSSLLNLALRSFALLGRFVLLIVLAQYLSPADVGLFALFTAASLWGVYLQGVEFHLFNVRELVTADAPTRARRTRDAFTLYAFTYVIAVVVWTAMFSTGFLPWSVFGWFLVTLGFEHATQETYRLLNAFGRPLAASLVVFVRSGAWMYVVAVLFVIDPSVRSLDTVMVGWAIGGFFAVALSAATLGFQPFQNLPPIDWAWLRWGLGVALPLLAGSLALRGISVFDRWFVGYQRGETELGIFGFYATIAGALPVLADSGVGAVIYPKLMTAWQRRDTAEYRVRLRQLSLAFILYVGAAVPLALLAVHLAVGHMSERAYAQNPDVFRVLLAAAAVWCLGAVPQYVLWAQKRDRALVVISILGLVTAVVADLVLIPRHGALGAAWGQFTAGAVMLVMRIAVIGRGPSVA